LVFVMWWVLQSLEKLMLEPIHMQVQKLDSFYKKRLQRKLRYWQWFCLRLAKAKRHLSHSDFHMYLQELELIQES
jgi:hypothetical protein